MAKATVFTFTYDSGDISFLPDSTGGTDGSGVGTYVAATNTISVSPGTQILIGAMCRFPATQTAPQLIMAYMTVLLVLTISSSQRIWGYLPSALVLILAILRLPRLTQLMVVVSVSTGYSRGQLVPVFCLVGLLRRTPTP